MEYDLADEKFRNTILFGAAVIILLPVALSLYLGTIAVEIFSVIVSSLLTLALVTLYFQQSQILDKQTKLMHRDYQSALAKRGSLVADGDEVRVSLRNSGRGKVRRIFLKSEIVSDTSDLEIGPGRVTMRGVDDDSIEIPPESEFQDYIGEVRFIILNHERFDPDRGLPFKMISRILSGKGIDSAVLKLTLEAVDEGIIEEHFSYTVELAEQELFFKPPKTREVDGEEREFPQATSVEEGIETGYATSQDINKERWDETAEKSSEA